MRRFLLPHSRHLRFAILCVLGYGEGNASIVYPLDTFSMYARMPGEDRSHLLVRDASGTVHRVTAFRSYHCNEPIIGPGAHCVDKHGIEYHYEDLARYTTEHSGPGALPVELITRTWTVRSGAPVVQDADCLIAHCEVSP